MELDKHFYYGGHDVASIVLDGNGSYSTRYDVYNKKVNDNRLVKTEQEQKLIDEGILREEFILNMGIKKFGIERFLKKEEFEIKSRLFDNIYFLFRPDMVIYDKDNLPILVDAKNVNEFNKKNWFDVPDNIKIQMQWYMGIANRASAYENKIDSSQVWADMGGRELVRFFIDYDDLFFNNLVDEVESFHENFIIKKIPPQTCQKISEISIEDINIKNTTLEIDELKHYNLLKNYVEAHEKASEYDKLKKFYTDELKKIIGDNSKAVWSKGKITYDIYESSSFDLEAFKTNFPDIYNQFLVKKQIRKFNFTKNKENQ